MKIYTPKPNLLENKCILVTGASKGIGREIALAFAKYQATVILLSRTIKDLEAIYDKIEQEKYPQAAIMPFNLATAKVEDYTDLRINIDKHFGKLDGIVHNAGILDSLTPIENYDPTNWFSTMQVNLNSTFLLTHASMPLLRRSNAASIIFTCSKVASQPKAYWGAYAAASAGCNAFMQVLADEHENTNININSITPDQVNTSLHTKIYPAVNPSTLTPAKDIILAYLYLMGHDSRLINGQNITAKKNFVI